MNRLFTLPMAIAAMCALPGQAVAQQAAPCLTLTEARSMVQVILPDIVSGLADKCKATTGASSFLSRSGGQMADRLRPAANTAWPAGKAVFIKLAGPQGAVLSQVPDETARTLFSAGIGAGISGSIKPETCPLVDRALSALSPLPPENMTELITLLLEAGMASNRSGGRGAPFSLCPASGGATPAAR